MATIGTGMRIRGEDLTTSRCSCKSTNVLVSHCTGPPSPPLYEVSGQVADAVASERWPLVLVDTLFSIGGSKCTGLRIGEDDSANSVLLACCC